MLCVCLNVFSLQLCNVMNIRNDILGTIKSKVMSALPNTSLAPLLALKSYKPSNFEILEKLQYGDKSELYDLENQYIIKYDSINNGYNCRRNESR